MQNSEVARMFDDYADILEIQAANPFRVRAYRNAARVLGDLAESLADIAADPERKLEELQGIGKDLAIKIDVILKTGQLPQLEEARREVPAGVVAMLRIGGLGPKKVATLFK
jgi:DNA polymerase (family X)